MVPLVESGPEGVRDGFGEWGRRRAVEPATGSGEEEGQGTGRAFYFKVSGRGEPQVGHPRIGGGAERPPIRSALPLRLPLLPRPHQFLSQPLWQSVVQPLVSTFHALDPDMFLCHGGRPTKGNGRKRKGVDEYASENRVDFTSRSIIRDGQLVRILVCRFCCQSIGARSDRIKEHLASKRHQKLKLEAFKEAADAGRDLSAEYSDDSAAALLPEPPITMLKFPGKALAHLLEGDGSASRELTPDAEERETKPNVVTPKAEGVSPGRGPEAASPQQLLCVRWGNFDSNIVSMFSKLRNQESFVDVTLWCEGRTIKAHKMILSACSTYFENLLTESPNLHPIIFLKDMRFWEIQALVEFMYRGEVSIHQEKLQSLLRAAESLQIKGLGSPSAEAAAAGTEDADEGLNMSVGMDLSNHPPPTSLPSHAAPPPKRRKKETPRRIDLPRPPTGPLKDEVDEEDFVPPQESDDSMTAHERSNHGNSPPRPPFEIKGEESAGESDEWGDEVHPAQRNSSPLIRADWASGVGDEAAVRERPRKGNPIKKVHVGSNNNVVEPAGLGDP